MFSFNVVGFSPAPGDYITVVEDLTFSADVDRVCRNVTSQDDTILEDDEEFTLTLTTTDGSVNLAPDQATFTIIDNDSKLNSATCAVKL